MSPRDRLADFRRSAEDDRMRRQENPEVTLAELLDGDWAIQQSSLKRDTSEAEDLGIYVTLKDGRRIVIMEVWARGVADWAKGAGAYYEHRKLAEYLCALPALALAARALVAMESESEHLDDDMARELLQKLGGL